MTPARVSWIFPWFQWSWMVWPWRLSVSGTVILVDGVTFPASSSDPAVSTFSTEPGS